MIRSYSRTTALFSTLFAFCWLVAMTGCREAQPPVEMDELIDMAISAIKTESNITDSTASGVTGETEKLPKATVPLTDQIQQLITEKKYSEAARRVDELKRQESRDVYWEHIADALMAEAQNIRQKEEPGDAASKIQESIRAAQKISDSYQRADFLINGLSRQIEMNIVSEIPETVQMTRIAIQSLVSGDMRKVRLLCRFAGQLQATEIRPEALQTCQEALEIAENAPTSAVRVYLFLDIARLCFQLNKPRQAKQICEVAINDVEQIEDERTKVTATILLAETMLISSHHAESDIEWLETAKNILHAVPPVIRRHRSTEAKGRDEDTPAKPTVSPLHVGFPLFSWEQLSERKDIVLGVIAKHECWHGLFAQTEQTIKTIESTAVRDRAYTDAVQMFVLIGDLKNAKTWAENVSDAVIKEKLRKEIAEKTVPQTDLQTEPFGEH